MDGGAIFVENLLREAVEQGKLDKLEGQGQPLDLSRDPFEDPLAPTLRRMLRDNGATHPAIEARRALEEEASALRDQLRRAWAAFQRHRSPPAWEHAAVTFRCAVRELNRQIKLNNLRTSIPNFHLGTLDAEEEIRSVSARTEPGE